MFCGDMSEHNHPITIKA